jgi:DNA-binding GntR family transcriptional regulator
MSNDAPEVRYRTVNDHEGINSETRPKATRRRNEHVLDELRELIVTGRLEPGTRLVEKALVEQFAASRGAIRIVLLQLEREGLVSSTRYRGATVLGVSDEELRSVLVPIRLVLERFSFARAVKEMSDADISELAKEVWMMERAAAEGNVEALIEADVRFHEFVIAHSSLPYTVQTWQSIAARVRTYFYRYGSERDLAAVAEEHRLLLDALATRDEEIVLAMLEEHITHPEIPPSPVATQ